MEHISFSQRITHKNSEECTVHEYPTENTELDGAVADIDGRYPLEGFAVNRESRMLIYVHSKRGRVVYHPDTGRDPIDIHAGDQVHIAPNEPYALMGRMGLFIASTPRWSPDQAEVIE